VSALTVTLLDAGASPDADDLACGLRAAGHRAAVIHAPTPLRGVDRVLRRRAFEPHAAAVPAAHAALRRDAPDAAHAFTLPDAYAAARWSARSGRPAVLSFGSALGRDTVAARRLRLKFLTAALSGCAAFTAADDEVAASVERWLGVRARVLDPGSDAEAFAALYHEVIGGIR
jgi:hypothetical protein